MINCIKKLKIKKIKKMKKHDSFQHIHTTEEHRSQTMHKGITGSIPNNEVKTYTGMLCLKSKHNPVAAMGHIMPICP